MTRIQPGTVAMVCASLLSQLDPKRLEDIYDSRGLVVWGVSARIHALDFAADLARDMCQAVERSIERGNLEKDKKDHPGRYAPAAVPDSSGDPNGKSHHGAGDSPTNPRASRDQSPTENGV